MGQLLCASLFPHSILMSSGHGSVSYIKMSEAIVPMPNLVLTHGIPPDFRGGVHGFIPSYAVGFVWYMITSHEYTL